MKDGHFHMLGYNANFSSTSGNLSAQFGLHYLNVRDEADAPVAHGMSASAVALLSFPTTTRFDNGIPKVAVIYYLGPVPSVLVSESSNYISFPLVLGLGTALSPTKTITLTPWVELSPGANLDTRIHDVTFENTDPNEFIDAQGNVRLRREQVADVLAQGVDVEFSLTLGARGGLDVALHASDAADFKLEAAMGSLGNAFKGVRVIHLGVAWVLRWDDIVPRVLPPEKRLLREDCSAIAERYRACRTPEPPPQAPSQYTPRSSSGSSSSAPPPPAGPPAQVSRQPPQPAPQPQVPPQPAPQPPQVPPQPVPQPQVPPQPQKPPRPPTMSFPPAPPS